MPASLLARSRACRLSAILGGLLVLLPVGGCDRHAPDLDKTRPCAIDGIDVSRHQGEIDWRAVAGAGIRFAWIKATEGGDYTDPAFRRNWALSRAAGLRRGAYHFVYWCRRAEDQAAWFVANVPADPSALPPVLDVEWNPGSRTCPRKVTREVALATMRVILAAMRRTYGHEPIVYAPLDFYREVMDGALPDVPLWVRNIGAAPATGYGDRRWLVWQYADAANVAGIEGDVDKDCFNGDAAALRNLASDQR